MCLMGIFSYLYLVNVVERPHVRLSHAMQKALALSEEDQLALFTRMGYLLAGKALLPKATVDLLGRIPGAGAAGGGEGLHQGETSPTVALALCVYKIQGV